MDWNDWNFSLTDRLVFFIIDSIIENYKPRWKTSQHELNIHKLKLSASTNSKLCIDYMKSEPESHATVKLTVKAWKENQWSRCFPRSLNIQADKTWNFNLVYVMWFFVWNTFRELRIFEQWKFPSCNIWHRFRNFHAFQLSPRLKTRRQN